MTYDKQLRETGPASEPEVKHEMGCAFSARRHIGMRVSMRRPMVVWAL